MSGFDYNRGVQLRRHPTTGMVLGMYKDEVGTYRNAHGTPVAAELAAEAGFPVERYRKIAEKRARMDAAQRALDDEFKDFDPVREIVAERGGFKLVHIGNGRHIIEDPDGSNLTPKQMTEDEGRKVFDKVVPKEDELTD